jgi:predicted MFS family arabinose efflux permease
MMLTAVLMSIAAHTPWLIIASSVFVFAVFCFCTSISRRVVKERVAEEYQTTAIGVADACFNTISGALALTYAGAVAQHYSVRIMLCALGAPSLAAVLILNCVFLKGRRKTA